MLDGNPGHGADFQGQFADRFNPFQNRQAVMGIAGDHEGGMELAHHHGGQEYSADNQLIPRDRAVGDGRSNVPVGEDHQVAGKVRRRSPGAEVRAIVSAAVNAAGGGTLRGIGGDGRGAGADNRDTHEHNR